MSEKVILGKRVFAVLAGCQNMINDAKKLVKIARKAARDAGATPVRAKSVCHRFLPHGVTAMVVLEESHVVVETWPELSVATVNIFTCGKRAVPEEIVKILAEVFQAKNVNQKPAEEVSVNL